MTDDPMKLHQLEGGSTGPGFSMLHFYFIENIFNNSKQPSFYLGYMLPSINVLTSD